MGAETVNFSLKGKTNGWPVIGPDVSSFDADVFSTRQLKEAANEVIDSGYKNLVIDLSVADYLDSTALGVCINITRRLRDVGGQLKLVVSHTAREIFIVTGLDQVISLHPDLEDAVNLGPQPS